MKISDFHSHILPGIDDGSRNLEESMELLGMETAQGVRRVVATPHFYPRRDKPERFLERRARAEAQLRAAIGGRPEFPEILMGAEVYYFPGISESDALPALTIGQTKCVLIEMPQSPWTESMYRDLAGIPEKHALTPIIAHVDRYIGPFRTHGIPQRLEELPLMVQANASFFLQLSTRSMALRMLRSGQIHVLGSDCHDPKNRVPNLRKAEQIILKALGPEAIDAVRDNEEILLAK